MIAAGGLNCLGKSRMLRTVDGAKRIDRLCIVADYGEAAPAGLQRQKDRGLKAVRVLILVDEHMVEALADLAGKARIR